MITKRTFVVALTEEVKGEIKMMTKNKWIALVGLVFGAAATAVESSAYGANLTVHTACDVAIKVLMALGLMAPVSLLGGATVVPSLPDSAVERAKSK